MLTPVQQAYWQGRQKGQTLGQVACQVYLELDCPSLADERLHQAVTQLFHRHELLRMRINEQGMGVIQEIEPVTVTQYHWDQLSARAGAKERYALRARLSHRMADLTDESGFQLIASHDGQNTRLHINVDMVIADAMSLQILLEELGLLLSSQNTPFAPLDYHFPQYLLEQNQHHQRVRAKLTGNNG